eukprot:COSAG02_NODE_1332_length_13211_cov_14.766397_5_plen_106_part_00
MLQAVTRGIRALCPLSLAQEARVGGAESNHAAAAADRDRCTAVDMPEDGSPDALSARQAYGKPAYHGPVALNSMYGTLRRLIVYMHQPAACSSARAAAAGGSFRA